jgi:1-acyl-sn-glycerol-3-phosphate acyltransferase
MKTNTGRPKVIVANHQSFMDTVLLTSYLPLGRAVDVKMYVASTLCKTPGLGTIVLAAGHIEVPFQASKTTDTNMSVDKNVLEERMQVFSKHIEGGGTGSWYPEGRLNREDHKKVGMFRAGGFAIAEEADVQLWGMAFVGVNSCWPSRASVGGRPSHIKMRLFLICESTHAHLRENEVSREQVGDSGEKARTFLADSTRVLVQEHCDRMREQFTAETGRMID